MNELCMFVTLKLVLSYWPKKEVFLGKSPVPRPSVGHKIDGGRRRVYTSQGRGPVRVIHELFTTKVEGKVYGGSAYGRSEF